MTSLKVLILIICTPLFFQCSSAEGQKVQSYTENGKKYYPAPLLPYESLKLGGIEQWRKSLVKEALKVRKESSWPRYIFGSADPSKGGFDCSGAMYYVLRRQRLQPPRTSASQYSWLKSKGTLRNVSSEATTLNHPDYRGIKPGDLVFWSGTYAPTDGRTVPVTHVGMFIGYMNGYEKPLMICSSKGRSFNGVRCDGYGVFDFKIPAKNSRSKIVGWGKVR